MNSCRSQVEHAGYARKAPSARRIIESEAAKFPIRSIMASASRQPDVSRSFQAPNVKVYCEHTEWSYKFAEA